MSEIPTIEVLVNNPIPSITILEGIGARGEKGEKGDKGDKGDTGDVSIAQLNALEARVADLEYLPVEVTSLSISPSICELGARQTTATITYTLNKQAEAVIVAGQEDDTDSWINRSKTISINITSNTTYIVSATDERGYSASKSATIRFLNGAYYGSKAIPAEINSDFIRSLTRILTDTRIRTLSVNIADNQYFWYAIPTMFGEPLFSVDGFGGGINRVATVSFTNASGYEENYYVYRSDHHSLGRNEIQIT